MKAVLKIPGNQMSAKITSVDDGSVHFDGGEDQALRITFVIPPMVGGNMYTISEGVLFGRGELMCFRVEDGAGLDNDVEIEFTGNTVQRVSVVWGS